MESNRMTSNNSGRRASVRKPGWLMTVAQHATYFNLLGEVYEKHGIAPKDREAYRKQIHTAVFGSPISAKYINSTEMFGKIKNHLLMLLDNVQATVETDHPEHDEKRRIIHNLQHYYLPLLAILLPNPEGVPSLSPGLRGTSYPGDDAPEDSTLKGLRHDPAAAYARAITRTRWRKQHLEDLTLDQLRHLRMDLQRNIQSKRKAHNEKVRALRADPNSSFDIRHWSLRELSVHDIHAAAALQCPSSTGCLICYPRHAVTVPALISAGPTADDNMPF
jgi:hypothetical protein